MILNIIYFFLKSKFLPNVIKYDRFQPEFYEDTKTYVSKRASNKKIKIGNKIYKNNIDIINNIYPFEEIFTGSNYKSYKHKYFLGMINNNIEPENEFQIYEISKIEWVDLDNAKNYFRNYDYEKIKILNELNKLLKTYKLYT